MTQTTSDKIRWTSADLELFPESDWKRYEIIDGELLVTRAPHLGHQNSAGLTYARLLIWSEETGLGQPFLAPGVVFSDADDVIPDVVWVQKDRLPNIVDESGHLTEAPDLVGRF
ncbi:MAG: Uma2 family endonuclease [Cyanobacteria bacterium P01_D01_bin.44]